MTRSTSSQVGLSAVIPTWRRPHLLAEVLEPLLSDTTVEEIIVVDDGSGDTTVEVCEQLAATAPKLRLIQQRNQGPAEARRKGARAAGGRIVLVLDDDVVAGPGLGAMHVEHHERDPHGLVLVGYMPPDLPARRKAADFPVHLYARDYEAVCRRYEADPDEVLLNMWGGHFSVRRDLLLAAADSVPAVPYHEDQILGWNLRALGCHGRFDPGLPSRHRYERTPARYFQDNERRGGALALLPDPPTDGILVIPAEGPGAIRALERRLAGSPTAMTMLRAAVFGLGLVRAWRTQLGLARVVRSAVGYRAYRSTLADLLQPTSSGRVSPST